MSISELKMIDRDIQPGPMIEFYKDEIRNVTEEDIEAIESIIHLKEGEIGFTGKFKKE